MTVKNVFLLGAGASHGCKGTNFQVPLGKKLFCVLRENFARSWGALPDGLKGQFEEDFERGMKTIWQQYSTVIPALMKDMAVFFSKIIINNPEENLPIKLIRNIRRKSILNKTVFSTINYDCLVELASARAGLNVNYFERPSKDVVTVFKIHGSCNFLPKNINASGGVLFTSGVIFDSGIKAVQLNQVQHYCLGDNALYPAMCIYMEDKPLQIASSSIKEIQKSWQEAIREAEQIIAIGVHPNLADKHIWDSISQTSAKVYFCGNEDGFNDWQRISCRNDIYWGPTFENTIQDILSLL